MIKRLMIMIYLIGKNKLESRLFCTESFETGFLSLSFYVRPFILFLNDLKIKPMVFINNITLVGKEDSHT